MNRIYAGDCLELFGCVDPQSVDLAFCDPPFNIGYKYDKYDDRRSPGDYLAWSKHWVAMAVRSLSPAGSLWVAIGDDYAAELKVIASSFGLTLRNWVVWHYTFGVHCSKKFTRAHTHLLYFVKDSKFFTFNDASIRVPSARQLKYRDKRANPKGRIPDDVWNFSRVCGTFKERAGFHGCQMPEKLLGRVIRACSNPGDLVLDPFAGSGTTLVVAKKLGREYLGFELSEDYAARANERCDRASLGDPLAGADACEAGVA